jgi:hypothetical protein
LLEAYAILSGAALRARQQAASDPPAEHAIADHRRPLGAGDQPTMHEAAPSLAGTRDGFEEDSHRAEHTTTADQF